MKRTFVPVLCLLACLVVILTADIPAACQEEFVRIQGDQFTYKGQTVRMKGTNYYPKNHMWASMWSGWDWDEMLTEVTFIREAGMNCARILVPYSNGGWNGPYVPPDRLDKLENLVNMFGQNGIRSCITLFDWETSFPDKIINSGTFNDHIYYLNTIVTRLKDNKYVFMWDVKNEPDHPANLNGSLLSQGIVIDSWDDSRVIPGKKTQIVNWLREMCQAIKDRDPNHPVSAGLRFYQNVKDVISFEDICIYHDYWWPQAADEILTVKGYMGSNQKPILVEEFGWPSYPPSSNFTEDDQLNVYTITLTAYGQYNIAGCIQWMTFDAANYGDSNHEQYFGLWRYDYSIKPAGDYYRDHFITGPFPYTDTTPPGAVSGFKAEAQNGVNYLSWTSPQARDYQATLIRYSTTGYPVNINDGQPLTDQVGIPGVSGSFLHQGLTNGVTYYYTAFARDRFGNYSTAANASGTPYVPPVVSILPNGTIETVTGGVANSWTAYRINDPGSILQFIGDSYFETAPVAQGISGLESSLLPTNSYVAAGIRQVVPTVPGKTYMFVGMQDLTGSASGARYLHNFGINTTGGTNPGSAGPYNTVGGAKWMGPNTLFWNNSSGGAPGIGGFHRVSAAYTAESNATSLWTGVTIYTGTAPTVAARFVADSMYLYELDNPINYSNQLVNPGFEQIFDLQNGHDSLPVGWSPAGGGIAQNGYLSWKTEGPNGRNGTVASRINCRRGHTNAGYMQRISTTPGTSITFNAYVRCWAFDGATNLVTAYVGIDPTGGTDITAGTVDWCDQPTRNNYWTQLSTSAIAQSSTATLFVRGSSAGEDPGQYHVVYFDDASAAWTPSDNIAPTNPTYAQDLSGAQDGQWTAGSVPSFIFGGASDAGGSGVAGYDIYWGTNSTGSTVTAGVANPAYQPAALTQAGTYYLRVRTKDAAGNAPAWATLFTYKLDLTAPSAPGPLVSESAYLVDGKVRISWTAAADAESGISGYRYCVGTSPEANDVLDWTGAGNVTSTEVLVPNPQVGSVYYITLKAVNGAGTDSGSSVWTQATAAATEATIGLARRHPAGTPVAIKGKVVSAVFEDLIYILEPDRSAGIGIDCPTRPAEGTIVDVVGRLADGNKVLGSAEVKAAQEE